MNYLEELYHSNLSLLTDLYQLTMANGYWKSGNYQKKSVFTLFYRKNPFDGDFVVFAGLEQVVQILQNFKFEINDIRYLANLKCPDNTALFDESFLNMLQRMHLECTIHAVPEGTVVFPNEPLIRVEGPLIQAQLIETLLLNSINFQSLIATKSARITLAAKGDSILEFGLRRAPGIDGSISATRASFIGGCSATSNVLAGKLFNIPVKGTQAHSWIMSFETEIEAFKTYAYSNPHNVVLLVDTYNTIQGVKNAIHVGELIKKDGIPLNGIRLDSGDLAQLSIESRKLLDEAGFLDTKIVASNDLDENKIARLKKEGAKIDIWGVGTQLVTGGSSTSLGGVYKLTALDNDGQWEYKMKLSDDPIKITNPGILNIRRYFDKDNHVTKDLIYDEHDGYKFDDSNSKNLLIPIFEKGKLVYELPQLISIRSYVKQQLNQFDWDLFQVELSKKISKRKQQKMDKHNNKVALLLVDIQVDFLPFGSLSVPNGDEVIPIANQLMDEYDIIIATQDWHPGNHESFAANHLWRKPGQVIDLHGLEQILWPMHCVQDSFGAEFPAKLNTSKIQKVIQKGQNPKIDSYSGFFDNGRRNKTELDEYLKKIGVKSLVIMGLATDYCVKYTVLDALELGYDVKVIKDGCRSINLEAGDEDKAFQMMKEAGAEIEQFDLLIR